VLLVPTRPRSTRSGCSASALRCVARGPGAFGTVVSPCLWAWSDTGVTDAYDENGWYRGALDLPDGRLLTTVLLPLCPVRLASFELARALQGLGAAVETTPSKHYPSGAAPLSDRATLRVVRGDRSSEVLVTVVPAERAPSVVTESLAATLAAGGQGLDALVRRARAVVFVASHDEALELLVAAAFARAWLGPIHARSGRVIGPKTAVELTEQALGGPASP
jgi:uncharacterized protein YceK